MKRSRFQPRRNRGKERPSQVFTFGPFAFQVDRAARLAANSKKYSPQLRRPSPEWVGPGIEINQDFVEQTDLEKPVIFATIITEDDPWPVLIDGNHRELKALRHQVSIPVITLDLEDTLKVLTGPVAAIQRMKQVGQRLGLLGGGREGQLPRG
ncbi:MAG: hypothetical protein JO112_20650 [Planctomycetes bacterium]|nr:hypothetical protein [Planctomycetota bacterium]